MKIEKDQLYSVSGGAKLSTATRTEFQVHFVTAQFYYSENKVAFRR